MLPSPLLLMATSNPHKVEEVALWLQQQGLGHISCQASTVAEGADENAPTFGGNAQLKAQFVVQHDPQAPMATWVLADDSGLVVEALSGLHGLEHFPGVHSNRWLTPALRQQLLDWERDAEAPVTHPQRCTALLRLLEPFSHPNQRWGHFACAMALYHVPTQQWAAVVEGRCTVWLTFAPKGRGGFGYDPIAQPWLAHRQALSPLSCAQLLPVVKNRLSHRGHALQQLLPYLAGNVAAAV